MHYGITYNVGDYAFDKHWFMSTDMTSCPSKLFQKPPAVADLGVEPGSQEHRRLSVALSVAQGLYDATRAHAISACGIKRPQDPPQIRYKCAPNADNVVICTPRREGEPPDPPPPVKARVVLFWPGRETEPERSPPISIVGSPNSAICSSSAAVNERVSTWAL